MSTGTGELGYSAVGIIIGVAISAGIIQCSAIVRAYTILYAADTVGAVIIRREALN